MKKQKAIWGAVLLVFLGGDASYLYFHQDKGKTMAAVPKIVYFAPNQTASPVASTPPPVTVVPAQTALPPTWKNDYKTYTAPTGKLPIFQGFPVVAYVDTGAEKVRLFPDQGGVFPRLYMEPASVAKVMVEFPQGASGDTFSATSLDGGAINDDKLVGVLTLGADKTAGFSFTLSANHGVSRVRIQNGSEATTLDFWAGPDLKFGRNPNLVNTDKTPNSNPPPR
jgi:hypothetical protein